MKCKYCGKNLIEGAKYCVYCAKPAEEEKEKEKKEKKNNIKIILISLIVFLIIVGSAIKLIAYNNSKTKTNKKVREEVVQEPIEQKVQIPNITKEEVKTLIDTYYFTGRAISENLFTTSIDDETKKTIAIKNISNDTKTIACEQISGFVKRDGTCINDEKHVVTEGRTIEYDILNNKYKYLFGKQSIDIPKENIKSLNEITTWEYDINKNNFLETLMITGFEGVESHIVYGVKDYSQEEEKLIVKVGYILIEPKGELDKIIFSTKLGEEQITYSIDEVQKDTFDSEFLNKYLDKLDTYEIIFNYEDDHYIFESIKKI